MIYYINIHIICIRIIYPQSRCKRRTGRVPGEDLDNGYGTPLFALLFRTNAVFLPTVARPHPDADRIPTADGDASPDYIIETDSRRNPSV